MSNKDIETNINENMILIKKFNLLLYKNII